MNGGLTLIRCLVCGGVYMRESFTDFRYDRSTGLVVRVERCPQCHRKPKKRRIEVVQRDGYHYAGEAEGWHPNSPRITWIKVVKRSSP